MGAVTSMPLGLRAPDQLPEAVQVSALELDQVSVLMPPLTTVAGLALIITVAAGLAVALPPPPPLQPVARIASNSAAAVRNEFQQCRCMLLLLLSAGCSCALKCAMPRQRT